ncbi:ABC transporter permease [Candidatus Woesearchaeota archaeon]|nr:ABC transporter permease [Candidatus Woesearchaeota archaeon]
MKPLFNHQKQMQEKLYERPTINPFTKIYFMLEKNLKLLIRTKTTAIIFILGPLIITALLAIAFNTSTLADVNIAVYSDSYSELTESLINNLSASNNNIIKANSEPDCIDSARFGDFQVCIIFPEDLAVSNDGDNIISIYVDNSRLNIANLIASQITTKVSIESSALSEDMISNILIVLDTANTKSTQTKSIVTELLSKNSEITSSIEETSNSLESLDLDYTSIDNSTTINGYLSTLSSACNSSSSTITKLKDQITALQNNYSLVTTKLTSAKDSIETLSTTLPTISSDISAQTSKLNSIETNLVSITNNIATIQVTNAGSIATPLRTEIESSSTTNSFLMFILPTMLTIIIMFLALLMSSSGIIAEKESKAYFRNFITPTNGLLFLMGEFLSNILVLSAQIVIILSVLYIFLKGVISQEALILTGLALLSIGIFFTLLGMLIGYLFNTKQTVTIASISTGMVLLFFSNTIIPLETLSSKIRDVLSYNPFILGETMLKKILLFNSLFSGIDQMLLIMGIGSLIVLIAAIVARSISKHYFST